MCYFFIPTINMVFILAVGNGYYCKSYAVMRTFIGLKFPTETLWKRALFK